MQRFSQTISLDGNNKNKQKGWVIRISTHCFSKPLDNSIYLFGLKSEEPIMMYTGFVSLLSLFILTFGWIQ